MKETPPIALIIDDDLSIRVAMEAALLKAGCVVFEVGNGRDGIQACQEKRPDLILLDVVMPEMDGFETCRRIRALPGSEHVQIMMVTGLDDVESVDKAFNAGANGFVTKPINWLVLGHKARYMLRAGRAFQELSKSGERLARTQKLARLGNWEIDLATGEFYCSPEAKQLVGLDAGPNSISLHQFLSTLSPEDNFVEQAIENAIAARTSFHIHYKVDHPGRGETHILNQGEIVYQKQQPLVMLGAVQDVSQLKAAENEIRQLAFYDSLTGLANRMLFLNRLEQEIATARRYNQSFALLYLDLDQFKQVNDSYGHHIGDLLLKEVSKHLKSCIRSTDIASRMESSGTIVARLGGDEFTIILADIEEPEHAAVVARRINADLPKTFNLDGYEVRTTTSVGISLYPSDGEEAATLLKHADAAMYQAKKNGRNTYQFFTESLNYASIERFALERDLGRAVERDQLELFYQPIYELVSGKLIGAEGLLRWQHHERGEISPGIFIPIAEDSGQIGEINAWVTLNGCHQWRRLIDDGINPGMISLNLSGYQFDREHILPIVDSGLELSGLEPERLVVEITENVLIRDMKKGDLLLTALKSRGIQIALDDFGTGYSSLSYLASFPVDILKIDRSFVMGSSENSNNHVIIQAIVAMGHSLNMKVAAEGVESRDQLELLKGFGVDQVQGFYFSRPVPRDEFIGFLPLHHAGD